MCLGFLIHSPIVELKVQTLRKLFVKQYFVSHRHDIVTNVISDKLYFGNAAFFRWWGVGVLSILDIFKGLTSNPLHVLVTSPSIGLNGSRRQ